MDLSRILENAESLARFFTDTLPPEDQAAHSPEFFLSCAKHALKVRREFPWCAALPLGLFLLDTACPRVNDEDLADCRPFFYRQLKNRVRGLSLEAAILEVNRWCAEHVAYRSTDEHTDSPLTVYQRGYGRCGEESVFAVNALRSVGIAARQVYAPRWSHCDDNHAWVEAWDGKAWRYLGACEPEPVLDRGWFTPAASRAMLVHARAFLRGRPQAYPALFPGVRPEDLEWDGCQMVEAVTARYGETAPLSVTVLGEDGVPTAGARVQYSIFNMAEFFPIAARKTDQNGRAVLNLGLGSVLVSVFADRGAAERLIHTGETRELTLTLAPGGEAESPWRAWDFLAPAGAKAAPPSLPPEQQALRQAWIEETSALWKQNHAAGTGKLPAPVPPGEYRAAPPAVGKTGMLTLAAQKRPGLFRQTYTLARRERDGWHTVSTPDIPAQGEKAFPLSAGSYRLYTATRLPSGDQLAQSLLFSLAPGEEKRFSLEFREGALADLLTCLPLPAFSLAGPEIADSPALLREAPYSLFFFLEPGQEPTEHICSELAQAGERFQRLEGRCAIHYITEREGSLRQRHPKLPEGKTWKAAFPEVVPPLTRSLYVDPERLPLLLLADETGRGLYASCGYRVGTAELLLSLLDQLFQS